MGKAFSLQITMTIFIDVDLKHSQERRALTNVLVSCPLQWRRRRSVDSQYSNGRRSKEVAASKEGLALCKAISIHENSQRITSNYWRHYPRCCRSVQCLRSFKINATSAAINIRLWDRLKQSTSRSGAAHDDTPSSVAISSPASRLNRII